MPEPKMCAHPSCNCRVAPGGDDYCSPYCRSAAGTPEILCNCGHPGCAVAAASSGMMTRE